MLIAIWILFLYLFKVIGAINEHDPRGLLLVLIWLPWLVPVILLADFALLWWERC